MQKTTLTPKLPLPLLGNLSGMQILLLLAFATLIFAMPALAQENPLTGISITPGSSDNKDLSGMFKFFIKLIIVAIPFVILVYAFSASILAVFGSLNDARRDGDLGKFFFNLLLIFIGIGVGIFVGWLLFELIGKFEGFWTTSSP